jgi:hypothetical protein
MTPQQQNDQYLRNLARDVRFLKYRAGAPHPITGGIFLVMLLPFLLIAVIGFFIEVGIQFHLIKPVPKHVQKRGRVLATFPAVQSNNHALKPEPTNQK